MSKIVKFPGGMKSPVDRICEYYQTILVAEIYERAAGLRAGTQHAEFEDGLHTYCGICGELKPGHGDPIMHPEQYLLEVVK